MRRQKNTHGAGAGLMADIERSADISSQDLDRAFRKLFRGRRRPRTFAERNQMIYDRLGFIPRRGN